MGGMGGAFSPHSFPERRQGGAGASNRRQFLQGVGQTRPVCLDQDPGVKAFQALSVIRVSQLPCPGLQAPDLSALVTGPGSS